MRCPECTVRNSVAAVQCKECGAKLARKNALSPKVLKYGAIGVAAVALLGLGAVSLAMIPSMFDSDADLRKVSRMVAKGPKSKEDADHLRSELENSVKRFLEKNVTLPPAEIAAKMQKLLPTSAYEIHVFDLPKGLKLVEVDTVLQPCNYIISGKDVAVLRKFDVFDEAKVLGPAGDVLVLLGHHNAQAGGKPQVKVFALTANGVKDLSDKSVPFFSGGGEGKTAFAANGKDIDIEMTVASRASEEELFTPSSLRALGLPDEKLKLKLVYNNAAYELQDDNGRGPMAALRAIAFTVADPAQKPRFRRFLTNAVGDSLGRVGKLKICPPAFEIKRKGAAAVSSAGAEDDNSGSRRSRRRRREAARQAIQSGAPVYFMGNAEDAFEVVLARGSSGVMQTRELRRVKVQGHGAESDNASVASTYENKTSTLVDKLLATPDDHVAKNDTNDSSNSNSNTNSSSHSASPPAVAVAPLAMPVIKAVDKTASTKVIEKVSEAEKGTVISSLSSETVKVRRGVGTHYRTIAEIPRGADVAIIGKKEGWYKVRVNGREGYIYGGFINCKTGDAYTTATVKSVNSVKDEGNRTLTHTQSGDRVVVLGGINNNKYKVQMANGRTGYIDKDALDVSVEGPPQFVP